MSILIFLKIVTVTNILSDFDRVKYSAPVDFSLP